MSQSKKLEEFSIEELLDEVKSRESKQESFTTPQRDGQEDLSQYHTDEIIEALVRKQKSIYGTDDRVDMYQVTDHALLNDANSVVALFESGKIVDNGDGTSTIQTVNFGYSENLCEGEKFREQPKGAFCTGFLVAPNMIATAGHCVNEDNVTDIRFVFGFRMIDASTPPSTISNTEIYQGVKLIGREYATADWALVQLDRIVDGHPSVKIRRTGKIADNQAVQVIGHPVGIPTKYAGGANVTNNTLPEFFVANLDTYAGNSGSPVFNSDTHEVEGILVRGETDFVNNGSCNVSMVYPTTGRSGEDCTRTTVFSDKIPDLAYYVIIPDWLNGEEVCNGDDMGIVRPSAEELGLTIEFNIIRNDQSFDHEEVVGITPPAGTFVKRGSTVTVSINCLEGMNCLDY